MIKKLKLVSFVASVLMLSACSDTMRMFDIEENGHYRNREIEFSNYVQNMTRASKSSAHSFKVGESMGVWGYQTTGEFVDTIFNNQKVDYVNDTIWTYDNKKLWNTVSTYKFYGIFPYSTTLYTIGDDNKASIANYVNPTNPDDQVDLMISEMRAISPFNTVDMIFHHILSNVNIRVKVADNFDTTEIDGVTLKKLHLSGIKNAGSYTQTGWTSAYAPVGEWSNQSGTMDIPDYVDVELPLDGSSTSLLDDCIMMPQELFSANGNDDVQLDAIFRVHYKDGTSSIFSRTAVRLAGISGTGKDGLAKKISSWDVNNRYNYTLALNPAYNIRIWDADGDGSLIIDPETGDTISKNDDTPTPGTMQYDPEKPNVIQVLEDTDGDGTPDTWVEYPIVWEDVDGDDLLEAGIDKDGDGHIDNVDDDNDTNQGGDDHKDPSDGDPTNNPDGKDVILVHVDTDGDGDVDEDDDWVQLEKDPETGEIKPQKEVEKSFIEFTATIQAWDDIYNVDYYVK